MDPKTLKNTVIASMVLALGGAARAELPPQLSRHVRELAHMIDQAELSQEATTGAWISNPELLTAMHAAGLLSKVQLENFPAHLIAERSGRIRLRLAQPQVKLDLEFEQPLKPEAEDEIFELLRDRVDPRNFERFYQFHREVQEMHFSGIGPG